MNSFQAIEEAGGPGHYVRIIAERQGNLDDEKPGPVEAFSVVDSGVGFTDRNFDSFETVDSPYKASRGGKGLGRFLWLKAFTRVEIESHFRAIGNENLLCRKFSFVANDEDVGSKPRGVRSGKGGNVRAIGRLCDIGRHQQAASHPFLRL
jgi:hypothetical protein